MSALEVPVAFLGQAGFRLDFDGVVIFIDPYLSDRVERIEGPELKRLRPAPFSPASVTDADYLLVTHGHMDHCDPETIFPMLASSPQMTVIGPYAVIAALMAAGMDAARGIAVSGDVVQINPFLSVMSLPAAHPSVEWDVDGKLLCLGFVIEYQGRRIYHSGDTSPDEQIVTILQRLAPVDVALLPINEKNFYRDKAGIIGNMSIREAFGMATDMAARVMVPMHYDMFKPNQAYLDELAVIYRELQPPFELLIEPDKLVL